ncbi:MAG: acyl--CoA ligase, partial [Steroidobacteraceae bacterium]|nr:acyl--CoA ligase [Steroidobacteraceae bacterium]
MSLTSENLRDVRIRVTTLGDLLLLANDAHRHDTALILPDERLSYGELTARALQRARALQALGVRSGEHVGLLMPTCIEFVECLFAIALCGAVAVPLNARYKPSELAYVIENGDLVTLLTTDLVAEHVDFVERLQAALPGLAAAADPRRLALSSAPRLRNIVLLGRSRAAGFLADDDFIALAAGVDEDRVHAARLRVRLRDPAIMLYTSGTTANPKGCLLSHEAMVRNAIA